MLNKNLFQHKQATTATGLILDSIFHCLSYFFVLQYNFKGILWDVKTTNVHINISSLNLDSQLTTSKNDK